MSEARACRHENEQQTGAGVPDSIVLADEWLSLRAPEDCLQACLCLRLRLSACLAAKVCCCLLRPGHPALLPADQLHEPPNHAAMPDASWAAVGVSSLQLWVWAACDLPGANRPGECCPCG